MRIAYLCADPGVRVGARKGAAVHLAEFARALGRRGAEVVVLVPGLERICEGIRVREVPPDELDAAALRGLEASSGAAPSERRVAAEIGQVLRDRAFERALEEEHQRSPLEAVVERLSLFSLAGLRFARRAGVPHALEVNAPLADEQARFRSLALEGLAHAVERILCARSDLVLCVSEPLRERALSLGAKPERVALLPNGVDAGRFHPGVQGDSVRARFGLDGAFVLGFVGSLRPWHGVEFLLEATAEARRGAPDLRLLVVGDGPQRERLRELATSLGLAGAVAFAGWVDHEEVPSHLAACDAILAPYPPLEPFYFSPLKVAEAMAVGRAVVAPDFPALRTTIRDGETGLLYRAGDLAGCVSALRRLRDEEGLRRRLGERAAEETLASRTWDRNAAFVLERILGTPARRENSA